MNAKYCMWFLGLFWGFFLIFIQNMKKKKKKKEEKTPKPLIFTSFENTEIFKEILRIFVSISCQIL